MEILYTPQLKPEKTATKKKHALQPAAIRTDAFVPWRISSERGGAIWRLLTTDLRFELKKLEYGNLNDRQLIVEDGATDYFFFML
jgi:hypothetical protein